jgi:hypothetical protein
MQKFTSKTEKFVNIRRVIRKDHVKGKVPMLQEYVKECVLEAKRNRVTSRTLFEHYKAWIELKTENDQQTKYLCTFMRFCRVSEYSLEIVYLKLR